MTNVDILIKLYIATRFVILSQIFGAQQAKNHLFSAESPSYYSC